MKEKPETKSVERGYKRRTRVAAIRRKYSCPLCHLTGSGSRKRKRENGMARTESLGKIGDTPGKNGCLSASGAGQHQYGRTDWSRDGCNLFAVKAGKDCIGAG